MLITFLMNSSVSAAERNRRWAWSLISAGFLLGALLGLWSFDGPVRAPAGFESVDALPRRLMRLAHIAMIALPVLNLHLADSLERARMPRARQELIAKLFLGGTIGLPALLAAAAFIPIVKYALVVPVGFLLIPALLLAAATARERTTS